MILNSEIVETFFFQTCQWHSTAIGGGSGHVMQMFQIKKFK